MIVLWLAVTLSKVVYMKVIRFMHLHLPQFKINWLPDDEISVIFNPVYVIQVSHPLA